MIKKKKIELFEIKTRNKYNNPKPFWITNFTKSTVDIYNKALELGFKVQIVTVWLLDDWYYEIEFEDFLNAKYFISKPKKYDRISNPG